VRRDGRIARLAQAMGLAAGEHPADAIVAMNRRLGLPSGLAEMGVQRDWFDRIVSGALMDHCHKTGPRLASAQDYLDLLDASM
jgi:alcohol dehydrogenase class IV